MSFKDEINKDIQELVKYREELEEQNKKRLMSDIKEDIKKEVIPNNDLIMLEPEEFTWWEKIKKWLKGNSKSSNSEKNNSIMDILFDFSENLIYLIESFIINKIRETTNNNPIITEEIPVIQPIISPQKLKQTQEYVEIFKDVFKKFKSGEEIWFNEVGDYKDLCRNRIKYSSCHNKIYHRYCMVGYPLSTHTEVEISYPKAREILMEYTQNLLKEEILSKQRKDILDDAFINEDFNF